ncbi:hypothetical protein FO519_006472 [Halicephalobus sp. NKZ332]|nr:hypothetical protein FO519_006472 [Halicephalobus sp. NKZ332]
MSKLIALVLLGTLAVLAAGYNNDRDHDKSKVECHQNPFFKFKFGDNEVPLVCKTSASNPDPDFCSKCCTTYGFSKNIDSDDMVGFTSIGFSCVCCNSKDDGRRGGSYGKGNRNY